MHILTVLLTPLYTDKEHEQESKMRTIRHFERSVRIKMISKNIHMLLNLHSEWPDITLHGLSTKQYHTYLIAYLLAVVDCSVG